MHVLHITPWYPNKLRYQEAIFIKRHISALGAHCSNTIWHTESRIEKRWGLLRKGEANRVLVTFTPIRQAIFIEWLAFFQIVFLWITRNRSQKFDLVNFYITYPNAINIRILRSLFGVPVKITEQHSAFHLNFGSDSKGLDRTRNIFHHGIPVTAVSESLANDIRRFSNNPDCAINLIDNIVEIDRFYHDPQVEERPNTLFCVAFWRPPKRPDIILKALADVRLKGHQVRLRMGGDGPQMDQVHSLIKELELEEHVELLGRIAPKDVADEMRRSAAFVHCSDYETFSVVCAEGLCCGTPVIASNVGGIPSFTNHENGCLVKSNTPEAWSKAIIEVLYEKNIDNSIVSENSRKRFSPETVGQRYFSVIHKATSIGNE